MAEGDWALIYNECWGVAKHYDTAGTSHNGYVLACGTGIETCGAFWGPFWPWTYYACELDPRKVWRSLAIAVNLSGERVWSRMDNFQGENIVSSAAEYVYASSDGKHTIITDEQMGMGF